MAGLDPLKDPYAVLLAKLSGLSSPPKARQVYRQFTWVWGPLLAHGNTRLASSLLFLFLFFSIISHLAQPMKDNYSIQ
jgi:hypothetical protein